MGLPAASAEAKLLASIAGAMTLNYAFMVYGVKWNTRNGKAPGAMGVLTMVSLMKHVFDRDGGAFKLSMLYILPMLVLTATLNGMLFPTNKTVAMEEKEAAEAADKAS